MLWVLITTIATLLGYLWLIRPYKQWTKRGVPQGKPKPIFGDSWGPVLKKCSFADVVQMNYNACPNARYYETYNCLKPSLLLRDPDLIKEITIKKFDNFVDHTTFITEDFDPLWGKNLFSLTGQRWRDMRSTLSPAFTSSKMRAMFMLISQSGEQFAKHFLNTNQNLIKILDIKDTFSRFTNDVIASVAFGVECDSLKHPNNEFYLMGKDVLDTKNFWKGIKIMIHVFFPKLCKYTGAKLFSPNMRNFFNGLVAETISKREKFGIVRPDVINILMEARRQGLQHEENICDKDTSFAAVEESEVEKISKTQKTPITDQDITAQALLFFFAGFETVSSQMCFIAYELAVNPHIQNKLFQEIEKNSKLCAGKVTYEILLKMKYMDMVISETLRKWPATMAIDRVCTRSYTIEPVRSNEVPVFLKEKETVVLPIYALHRDPLYYPDPEQFDPERFSDENISNIKPFTYLPFGTGPRSCIGSRFALLEMKILLFHLLTSFEIIPLEETEIPVKLSLNSLTLTPQGKLSLGLKKRHT